MIGWLGGFTPDALVAYCPSDEAREQVASLIQQDKNEGLAPAEASELAYYLQVEHLLQLAKARAQHQLAV